MGYGVSYTLGVSVLVLVLHFLCFVLQELIGGVTVA